MTAALDCAAIMALGVGLRHGLGIFSLTLAGMALAGTLYALSFTLVGIIAGRPRNNPSEAADEAGATRFLVCIPAHNEGSGLQPTVAGVLAQRYPAERFRCIVIADNCTDDTVAVAEAAGAQVLERSDLNQRGKGHALAWAFAQLQESAWDAVCVIDADTVIAPDFLLQIDRAFRQGARVVQGRYDFVHDPESRNWIELFTAISKAAENSFVYRARERMGLMQLLQGNGFAVRREVLEQVPWRAHSIVEDAEYAMALGEQGIRVQYQERAQVWSRQASTAKDVQPQRVRWASGTWQLFRHGLPSLARAAWRQKSLRPLEAILMLLTTSRLLLLYLLVFSMLTVFTAPAPLALFTGYLLVLVLGLQVTYMFLMFRFAAERPAPLQGLVSLPLYVAVVASAQALAILGVNRRVWWRTTR